MTNITYLKRDALSARVTGWTGGPIERAPSLEDATALIRRLTLTPEQCMTLLNVISGKVADQRRALRDSGRDDLALSETCYLIDQAADEISNIQGVTV